MTADSIIRAVALCARLNDNGEWINSPKHVVHYASKVGTPPPAVGEQDTNPNRETVTS